MGVRAGWACRLILVLAARGWAGQAQPPSELQKAVEEFRVQTRSLGLRADSPPRARVSQAAGAKYHGRVFYNVRNDFFDAVPHEIAQRGEQRSLLRRNQFGFNVAGPVMIPKLYHGGRKTYFSLSYEGVRERISRSYLQTIATAAERTGDWSATVDQAGNPLPIYDPQTTRLNPGFDSAQAVSLDNLQYVRDVFPGSRMPASRLDPVAQKALTFYPLPNANVGPFFRNNYFVVSPETNRASGMIGKVDHNLGERHRVTFGFSFTNGFAGAARYFETAADSGPSDRQYSNRRAYVEHVFTYSPRTLNTLTLEASTSQSRLSHGPEGDYASQIGLRGVAAGAFPVLQFSPYLTTGDPDPSARSANNTWVLTDSFSTRRGKHTLRGVAQHVRYQVNCYMPTYPAGRLRFSSGLTSLPGIVNTGHAFASYLLGLAEYGEVSLVESPSYFRRSTTLLGFGEHYEAAKGLHLHLSLNAYVATPRVEKYDRQSTVDLSVINPANGRPGALIAAGRNGVGRAFQPLSFWVDKSASLSWNPRGNPKWVVRLSYGRSSHAIPIYGAQWGTQGFSAWPAFISPNVRLEPALTLSQGFPPPAYRLPDLRLEAANDTVADLVHRSSRRPLYQSVSFSLERELPGSTVLTVGGYTSGGRDLLLSNSAVFPNALRPEALQYRDKLLDEQFNRSLRPFPQFKGFDVYSAWPLGRYHRDAANLRLEKRSSKGLTVSASYEFAKQMDDYSGPYGRQDNFNRKNEWSLTAGYNPHRVSLTYAYELPVGPNKPFLVYSGWRRHLVEGWSLSGITSFASGEPLALHPQFNNTGGVYYALNVNVVPGVDPHVDNPSPDRWFNPAAFEHPADFTMGNASRTHPTLRGPVSQNHDLSLTKRFTLAPERLLELSAVGMNFLNHANWTDPDTVIGTPGAPNVNAGRIIGSRGGRVIQMGLRLSF